MDAVEQIKQFKEFLEEIYKAELSEGVRKGLTFISLNFDELSKFNPDLAEDLLDMPEETIKAAELAVEQFDLPKEVKNFKARFYNLPESQKIVIRNIRSKHINKLITVDGAVRQKSDVRPQVTAAKFECPSCGNTLTVLQLDTRFKEPTKCGCGRKGK